MTTTAAPAKAEPIVGYRPHPKQWEALSLLGLGNHVPDAIPVQVGEDGTPQPQWVEEFLYGGQSGGAKSHLCRAIGVTLCTLYPGTRIPIFRRQYTELEDSHIPWIQQEIRPPVAAYNSQRHELRFANGSVLMFRHCENEQDVYNYLTAEWGGLIVDQAEQFTEFMLRMLRHRVRQPKSMVSVHGQPWRPVVFLSANPGGMSHNYLRRGFIQVRVNEANEAIIEGAEDEGAPIEPGTVFTAPEADGGARRCYLPARLTDNPSLDPEDYRRRLKGLPEHLVSAYLSGDWGLVVGAFFKEWQAADPDGNAWHVWTEKQLRDLYDIPDEIPFPPQEWQKWAGVDGGFNDPWVVLFAAKAPDGRVVVYREFYGRGVSIPKQAAQIKTVAAQNEEKLAGILCDPAMFTRNANLTWSDAQVYADNGVTLTRGTNAREPGWRRVREFLGPLEHDGYPGVVFVAGRCPHLVETLPTLLTDATHHEDIATGAGKKQDDHAADCLRYLLGPAAVTERETDTQLVNARMDAAMDYRGREDRAPELIQGWG
jgi:hypothetical protein